MKSLVFYIKTLKSFIRINTTASIVLLSSISVIFISSMYFFSAFMSYRMKLSEYYRMRTATCTYNDQQNQLSFINFPKKVMNASKGIVENITFKYDNSVIQKSIEEAIINKNLVSKVESYTHIDFTIVSYFINEVNNSRISIGDNIDTNQENESKYVIVYNKSIFTSLIDSNGSCINIPNLYDNGDSIEILGKNYRIIGIINNFGYSIIPYTTGLKNLKLKNIEVSFKSNTTDEQRNYLLNFIKNEYPGLSVSAPPNIDNELIKKLSLMLFLLCILCFMGMVYLLYIYKYIIENNKKAIMISRILGLSKSKSIFMILVHVFIINSLLFAGVALIYRFILTSIFDLVIPNTYFFLAVYVFIMVVSSLIILPFAKKISKWVSVK